MHLVKLTVVANGVTPVVLCWILVSEKVIVVSIKVNVGRRSISTCKTLVPLSRSWPESRPRSVGGKTRCNLIGRTKERLSDRRTQKWSRVGFGAARLDFENINLGRSTAQVRFQAVVGRAVTPRY